MSHKLMPQVQPYPDIHPQDAKSQLPPVHDVPISVRCNRCRRRALANQAAADDGTCVCGWMWRN